MDKRYNCECDCEVESYLDIMCLQPAHSPLRYPYPPALSPMLLLPPRAPVLALVLVLVLLDRELVLVLVLVSGFTRLLLG